MEYHSLKTFRFEASVQHKNRLSDTSYAARFNQKALPCVQFKGRGVILAPTMDSYAGSNSTIPSSQFLRFRENQILRNLE